MSILNPQQQFFISDKKIHTVSSRACVLQPPPNHIYEVFRVISGVPLFIEDHMQRLENSMISAEIKYDIASITEDIEQLMKLNQYATGNIKIVVWKSLNSLHHLLFYDKHVYPDDSMFEKGIEIGMLDRERQDPNIKLFDSTMRTDAARLINDNAFFEVLLVTREQFITEGSRSNVFLIKNDKIITPPANQVLEGVTRKHVINLIKDLNLNFIEIPVHLDELNDMESVFLTGTSRRVLPVHTISPNTKKFNTNHPYIRLLQKEFIKRCEQYINLKKPI